VRNTGTAKLPAYTFTTCKRMTLQKLPLKWEYREKSCPRFVPRHATKPMHLSVVKSTCKGAEACMALLARKCVSVRTLALC